MYVWQEPRVTAKPVLELRNLLAQAQAKPMSNGAGKVPDTGAGESPQDGVTIAEQQVHKAEAQAEVPQAANIWCNIIGITIDASHSGTNMDHIHTYTCAHCTRRMLFIFPSAYTHKAAPWRNIVLRYGLVHVLRITPLWG